MQLPGEFSPFIKKKVFFCLVVGGVTPPYTLSGPTTKLCVSSLICKVKGSVFCAYKLNPNVLINTFPQVIQ